MTLWQQRKNLEACQSRVLHALHFAREQAIYLNQTVYVSDGACHDFEK
jgi:hypothetical protein